MGPPERYFVNQFILVINMYKLYIYIFFHFISGVNFNLG